MEKDGIELIHSFCSLDCPTPPGMQTNQSTGFIKASACLKHFAAYSEETGRGGFAAMVTAQDMTDTYLPAFEAGVETGKASGIMCSYNAESYGYGIDGKGTQNGAIPSCANKGLLNDLAREKWGFNGRSALALRCIGFAAVPAGFATRSLTGSVHPMCYF